jgi:hypothetical protein
MVLFLKIVGGFLVAFFIFALILYWWVRRKLRSFGETLGSAFRELAELAHGAGVPPMRIQLEPVSGLDWGDPDAVGDLEGPLVAVGFSRVGDFEVEMNAPVKMRALAHTGHSVFAVIYEVDPLGVWLDLHTKYADGSSCTYATSKPSGMDYPANKRIVNCPGLGSRELLDRCLSERPPGDKLPCRPEDFKERFERAHAEEMDWRAARGGPSEEEIRRIAAADGSEADGSMVQVIQTQWRNHFNEFWEDEFRNRFMESADITPARWEDIRDRIVFVHDRATSEQVVEHFESTVYEQFDAAHDDTEDEADEDDDPAEAKLEEFREIARNCPPREAFVRLNDTLPARLRFERYGEVHEPFYADVWLLPRELVDE